jgi:hypothetical protein
MNVAASWHGVAAEAVASLPALTARGHDAARLHAVVANEVSDELPRHGTALPWSGSYAQQTATWRGPW